MSKINILLALAVLTVFSCKRNEDATPTPSNTATITYKLISGSNCAVFWKQNGADSSVFNISAPWSKSYTATTGTPLQMIATKTGGVVETVAIRIEVNGVIRQQQGSTCPINGTVVLQDTL